MTIQFTVLQELIGGAAAGRRLAPPPQPAAIWPIGAPAAPSKAASMDAADTQWLDSLDLDSMDPGALLPLLPEESTGLWPPPPLPQQRRQQQRWQREAPHAGSLAQGDTCPAPEKGSAWHAASTAPGFRPWGVRPAVSTATCATSASSQVRCKCFAIVTSDPLA